MRPGLLLLCVLVAVVCAPTRSHAQTSFPAVPVVIPMSFDTLSTVPFQTRFRFGMQNPSNGFCVDLMRVDPKAPATLISLSLPTGWTQDGIWWFHSAPFCPGQSAGPFEIVSDSPRCFVVLFTTPIPEDNILYDYCVDTGMGQPVPAQPTSWGKVKAVYR